jgi:hypothetical protein
MQRSPEEEMARLGSLALRAARFLEAAAGAYYMFAYAMGVTGSVYVAVGAASVLGVSVVPLVLAGVVAGVAIAFALTKLVAGPIWGYLASKGFTEALVRGGEVRSLAVVGLPIAAATMAPSLMGVEWLASVAWYPGLGLGLAAHHFYQGSRRGGPWGLYAGASILATSPAPILAAYHSGSGPGNLVASGLLLLLMLAWASAALRSAARRLEEQPS